MISFASDNYAPVHADVLRRISEVNSGHECAYGGDQYTEQAIKLFRQVFDDPELAVYFMFNGTGANSVGLFSLLKPYESIITAQAAHVDYHECGAIERLSGAKLIAIKTVDGKLSSELIAPYLKDKGDEHITQNRIVSISQCTELGTVYSIDELRLLCEFCHQQNLLVHMDGSRISNAAVSLQTEFKVFTKEVGVDVLSFGGTKNGLMMGEAVIFLNNDLGEDFKYYRKQSMQLASKMRYLAAQFLAFFENNLWRQNAIHANHMTQYFQQALLSFPEVQITQQVQSNAIFARMPLAITRAMQAEFHFYDWDISREEVRLMCSFDTTKDEIDQFIVSLSKKL